MANEKTETVPEETGLEAQEGQQIEEGTAPSEEAGEKSAEEIEAERKAAEVAKAKAGTEAGVQRRIDRETGRRKRAEEEAAYWRGRAEATQPAKQEGEPSKPWDQGNNDKEPVESDFLTHAEYLRAVTKYDARQEVRREQAAQQRQAQEAEASKRQAEFQAQIESVVDTGIEIYEDFEEVTDGKNLNLSPVMIHAILDNEPEMAAKIEYHLGKNPAEAARIAALSPTKQVREIASLEAKLREVKPSSAPPPPPTVGGKAKPTTLDTTNPSSDKSSIEDWMKAEEEREAKAAGARGGSIWR